MLLGCVVSQDVLSNPKWSSFMVLNTLDKKKKNMHEVKVLDTQFGLSVVFTTL